MKVPFRSKDSTYRRVLQDSKSYCAWSDGACALTTEAAVELLKGSSSQTSEYILALFVSHPLSCLANISSHSSHACGMNSMEKLWPSVNRSKFCIHYLNDFFVVTKVL